MAQPTIALAITGASGAQYGLRLLEQLIAAKCRVYVMVSKPAQVVFGLELDLDIPSRPLDMQRWFSERYGAAEGQLQVFSSEQWTAPIASGSNAADAMVICPCTAATSAAVAQGLSRSLIERAADVMLKERRQLLIVLRETPLSSIHLENLLRLSNAGATIMPAAPGFYNKPESVDELVDFMVARIMDHLRLDNRLSPRWGANADLGCS
ncbi:MAG: UbiX family flavin prenyltransferase [Gammaproteobacteria bacterium]|nr:UbiX family flavin prenyltransferase [Gammaproteobacteria bacterium]